MINIGSKTEQIEYKKGTGELKEGVISIAAILNKHAAGCKFAFRSEIDDFIVVFYRNLREEWKNTPAIEKMVNFWSTFSEKFSGNGLPAGNV